MSNIKIERGTKSGREGDRNLHIQRIKIKDSFHFEVI